MSTTETLSQIIKDKVVELVSAATIHGPSKVVAPGSTFRKLFWASLVILSSSYSCFLVIGYIQTYLQYSVLSVVGVITDNQPEFPKVEIEMISETNITSCRINNKPCDSNTKKTDGANWKFNNGKCNLKF